MFFTKTNSAHHRENIEDFLNLYCARFRDYDTVGEAIYYNRPMCQYNDICFATADFLFQTIKKEKVKSVKKINKLSHYLSQETVIQVDYDSSSQSHSFILIPFGEKAYMVQSVGRMVEANWKLMNNSDIIKSINALFDGIHEVFFGYQDDGDLLLGSISVVFCVSKRKHINAKLLPDLSPYKEQLDELRSEFERDEMECACTPSLSR